jgi:hypothetical protein
MGRRSLERSRDYEWDAIARRYTDFFERVVAARRR